MNDEKLTERAGLKLKQLRESLALTLREVEAFSRKLAEKKKNYDFFVSRGWLNNAENGDYTPGPCKLYTLGAIYRTHWTNLFAFYGLHLGDFERDQAMFAPPRTQLISDSPEAEETIVMPLQSQGVLRLDQTNLFSRLVQIWGEVPIRLLQHLDLRHGTYGFVGIHDKRMSPIIRPGSIVQIDQDQRKLLNIQWGDEYDRPIYFLELRGEFLCSWCEIGAGYLSAIPHPNSNCEVRRFAYPQEAEIVGRVVSVTMRLAATT
jgi:transcriptional regulator with XRE-family HTH domain